MERICLWCKAVIPRSARRDARFCSVRCRQASWRFRIESRAAGATDRPMRFCYADPPYPGCAGYYPERAEVDHTALIACLVRDFPDGWALSTSAEALRDVWHLCPAGTRLCVWVKAARRTRSRRALSTYEALLVCGGRPLRIDVVQDLRDALVYEGRYRAFPGALVGMKPPQFAEWMFRQLGAMRGDALVDLYPGSGAIGRAWERYTAGISDASHVDQLDGSSRRVSPAVSDTSLAPGEDGRGNAA